LYKIYRHEIKELQRIISDYKPNMTEVANGNTPSPLSPTSVGSQVSTSSQLLIRISFTFGLDFSVELIWFKPTARISAPSSSINQSYNHNPVVLNTVTLYFPRFSNSPFNRFSCVSPRRALVIVLDSKIQSIRLVT